MSVEKKTRGDEELRVVNYSLYQILILSNTRLIALYAYLENTIILLRQLTPPFPYI
jgi:hypothetical protein